MNVIGDCILCMVRFLELTLNLRDHDQATLNRQPTLRNPFLMQCTVL